ncbi:B-cell linker protein isoform X3 [Callorhinchus milii]|uniref:B-cell linker protein isoform X3 n=1 Tax=Callorhinchus milii TaxID=7868 RepID=UPI0004573AB6|nr:B-cell linker protein isoform X3 [Callorhinchus milii]|eukprot:gi/632936354/ref/XP_007894569.1/ PREDICTED: B-cell linker protein isoform X3 [Callorhinchus milii]
MTTKSPTREECEDWTVDELKKYLWQNNMQDSANVVNKYKINGYMFLNSSDGHQNRFNSLEYPQIQKIVQDIKKNDGGIIRKFKKFTRPAPPNVPQRDYSNPGAEEAEGQWSEDEFDNSDYENPDENSDGSVTYEAPGEDDENYEPPPSENKTKIVSRPLTSTKSEYADHRPGSSKAAAISRPGPILPKPANYSPKLLCYPPRPAPRKGKREDDEDDYIVPVENNDPDEAYIDPTETDPSLSTKPPVIDRAAKPPTGPSSTRVVPGQAAQPCSESPPGNDVYEIPDTEETPQPAQRVKPQLPKPVPKGAGNPSLFLRTFPKLTVASERKGSLMNSKAPSASHDVDSEDYEVCDPESNEKPEIPEKPTRFSNPSAEAPILPARPFDKKPQALRLPPINKSNAPELPSRPIGTLPRPNVPPRPLSPSSIEQDSSVNGKPWYTNYGDRKAAEEALNKSNKDGSFLIRKSSGQDSKQPYTLVVLYKRRVYNIPVRYVEATKEYALGRKKSGEDRFASVAEIIENHQRNALVLIDSQNNTKDSTKLKHPVKIS